MRKENTYKPVEVNYHGGMEYGSNIHFISVQINQHVWDMIKILNNNHLYGFDFQTKIGIKKTIVILTHQEKEQLEIAKKLLKGSHDNSDVVFLTKVIKKKSSKLMWIFLAVILISSLIGWEIFSLYKQGVIFNSTEEPIEVTKSSNSPLIVEEIEIDIKKLTALKDSFSEQNNSIDASTMKAMEITTTIISSLVSEEEKKKYSSKELVDSFKGKGGIRLVVKNNKLDEDFNASVKELNEYANHFIQDNNVSLALQCYDKALKVEGAKESEILTTLVKQGELYQKIEAFPKAEKAYKELQKRAETLIKDNSNKHEITQAWSLAKLSKIHKKQHKEELAREERVQATKIYNKILMKLNNKDKGHTLKQQIKLAWTLNLVADFYTHNKKELPLAIALREEALTIYKKLSQKNPKKFTLLYYKTLNSLGKTYLKINKIDLAQKTYRDALQIITKVAKKSPSKYKSYQALSFRALGNIELKKRALKEAEAYYGKALDIYQKLNRKNKNQYNLELVEIEICFAELEYKRKAYGVAQKRYAIAIHAYKEMNRKVPLKYNLKIAHALNRLALIKISEGDAKAFIEAEIELFKAISFTKKVKKITPKEARNIEAESYAYLSYLATLEKNMIDALEYYKKVSSLLKK